jgi:hypothetical protein
MELQAKGLTMQNIGPPPADSVTVNNDTVMSHLSGTTLTSSNSTNTGNVIANNNNPGIIVDVDYAEVKTITDNNEEIENNKDNETTLQQKGGHVKGLANVQKKNLLIAF